jgi:hypothetical protein
MRSRVRWFLGVAMLALLIAAPASAGKPDRQPFLNLDAVIPAGVACSGFDLGISFDAQKQTVTTFFDNEGNAVRQLVVGQLVIRLTNENTGASLATQLGGAFHIYFNADGTLTLVGTGNSFLSLFPTDIPAGPSSTLYSGRLVFDVDPATGVFTLRDEARNKIDVCAALTG